MKPELSDYTVNESGCLICPKTKGQVSGVRDPFSQTSFDILAGMSFPAQQETIDYYLGINVIIFTG